VLDEFLSYDELLLVALCVEVFAGLLYVCPAALRTVAPVVALLVVEVLRDTEPEDAGLLEVVDPLPTAARVAAVLLVPNDVLDVVAVWRPAEAPFPDGALFTLAVVLPAIVLCRLPRYTSLLFTIMCPPP
jgi:hypothetical protein